MTVGSIARRYAKALYELAVQDRRADETGVLLREFAEGLEEAGRANFSRGVLEGPARRKIGDALAQQVGRDSLMGRFLRLVAERDRLGDLALISEWYAKLEDRAAGRVRIAITVPTPLTDAEVAAICQAFGGIAGGDVVAEVNTDSSLLGGAIVELEGRVFDGSIKNALARLASRMAGTMNGSGHHAGADVQEGKRDAD